MQPIYAQAAAKQGRLKIWEAWTPEDDAADGADADGDAAAGGAEGGGAGEVLTVTVTEVVSGNEFFLQVGGWGRPLGGGGGGWLWGGQRVQVGGRWVGA